MPAPLLLADTDALVAPMAAAFCDLDRRIFRGATPFKGPFPLGHEAMGVVVDVGPEAEHAGVAPGQRVVLPFYISCGTCPTVPGPHVWRAMEIRWGGHWGGLFDDLVRVPYASSALVPVPDSVSSEQAAAVGDNLTDAYLAVASIVGRRSGTSVLVLGGTPSPSLLIVMFATHLGANSHICRCQRRPLRLVSYTSQTTRLLPGDLLLTGSPAGNGGHWGQVLRDRDVLTGRIAGLGVQRTRCVAEPP